MISFRFHLLSLVAAFLALAVGIVIGTTLADRAIVDGLRNRVDTVSANLDERQAANDRLQAENDRLKGFLDTSGGRLVADELTGQPVVIITEKGVGGPAVDRTQDLVQAAGGSVRSRVEIQPEWALDTPAARRRAAAALGISSADAATLRGRIASLLVADLASPVTVPDDGTGAIDAAVDEGLISYQGLDETVLDPDQATTFIVVTGSSGEVDGAVLDLSAAVASQGSPAVAAEVFDEADAEEAGIDRGDALADVRADDVIDDAVATVDDLELREGQFATVLALADAIEGLIGHYGYGPDVDGVAPELAAP